MKYVMLIYQGTALERQAALPDEEQKQGNGMATRGHRTPGVRSYRNTPRGSPDGPPT
jgi:hypothetical protein